MSLHRALFVSLCVGLFFHGPVYSQDSRRDLPREDVIDVPAFSEGLCVSNLFQSDMVLQRDKPIAVWGQADPGEQITVSFAGQTADVTTADDRSWKVVLPPVPADTQPQQMIIQGREQTLTLENILVGDVWVLGGQSNMEFPLSNVENGNLEIVSARFDGIRILTIPAQNGPETRRGFPRLHEYSSWFSRHFRKGDWDVCRPEVVRELSAIGYVFARRLHMASQVPIGVIDVSRGGTTVETWTPDAVLRSMDSPEVTSLLADWDQRVADYDPQQELASRVEAYRKRVAELQQNQQDIPADLTEPADLRPGPAADQNRPGNCYAAMMAPLAGLHVKGAVFHQGYNNCFDGSRGADMYRAVFPRMIAAWRTAFEDPQLPFGILSLCTEGNRQTRANYSEQMLNAGPFIREAQYRTFLDLWQAGDTNIGFTSTYDLRRRWYHPQLKIPAGERIARWALATQYGFSRELKWKPPVVESMQTENGRIVLRLDQPVSAVEDGGVIEGFAVAGADGLFHPADASRLVTGKDDRGREQTDPRALELTSPMVPEPLHYRYAWARNPMGNLQVSAHSDIPFATQRSDSWSWNDTFELVVGRDAASDTGLERAEQGELRRALRAEDDRRRLKEAEEVIAAQQNN